MKPYPTLKVFIAFSLCPALVAPIFSAFAFLLDVSAAGADALGQLRHIGKSIGVGVLTGIFAMLFYGIPAIVAAAIYAIVKPFRNWRSLLMIAMTGALSAYVGSHLGPLHERAAMGSAVLGAVFSVAIAVLVLPRKTDATG